METWCNLKYDDETIQNAIYVDGDKTKSKKIYEKKNPAHRSETITYTIDIDHKPSYRTTNKAPTDNGFCRFIFTGIYQNGNFFNTINESFRSPIAFTRYLKINFKEKTEAEAITAAKEAERLEAERKKTEAEAAEAITPAKEAERLEAERKKTEAEAAEAITAAEAAEAITAAEAAEAITAAEAALSKSRNQDKIIHFYGNYEPEGANNELSNPVDLASVLKLRIAKGNWIHYNYQLKVNPGNLLRTFQITQKYPYLHLKLTPTADGKWTVKGKIYPIDGDKKYYIKEGEFPPKNKGGRVGGSKMGRSTVLGRIMSIIRGSIKHVTRKKGRKPRSKTRRYKNKSQKKEKNKLNITKKVRFNRNKI